MGSIHEKVKKGETGRERRRWLEIVNEDFKGLGNASRREAAEDRKKCCKIA